MKEAEFKYFHKRILSSPVMINLELTSGCNIKCRHCYNYWRDDTLEPVNKLTLEKMDELIDMIIRDKVFHIVLTGGEPFMNFDVLEHSLKRLHDNNVTTSVNTNLMLATPEKLMLLKDTGVDHFLTSLNSYDPETNDYMTNNKGAFDKIVSGIKLAIEHGIRISVNMIVSEPNKDHVYDTAKFCAELGVQRIFATRLVPSFTVDAPEQTDFNLDIEGARKSIDDMLRAKRDFGIGIGTLISYPLCLLGDLQKYEDFVGRGCPAQRGNRMVIDASGETHACTHEEESYGNVFDVGITGAFSRMSKWHDGSYLYQGCADCEYINICSSGCRSASYGYFKRMDDKDSLFVGRDNITLPYKISIPDDIVRAVDSGSSFIVPDRVRFREEDGFYSINVRWANTFTIDTELARFLIDKQKSGDEISLSNMIGKNPRQTLMHMVFKEGLVPCNAQLRESFESGIKLGCSVNPEDIPDLGL